jgi:hypothetical protein
MHTTQVSGRGQLRQSASRCERDRAREIEGGERKKERERERERKREREREKGQRTEDKLESSDLAQPLLTRKKWYECYEQYMTGTP